MKRRAEIEGMSNRHLLRGLLKLAGIAATLAALSAVLAWRWNHEMVRVYDFLAIPWWLPGAVLFSGFAVWAWWKRREIFGG